MKNFILFLLAGTSQLMGEELSIQPVRELHEEKHSFFYVNCGTYFAGEDLKGIDFGAGYRSIRAYSGFDFNVGGTWFDPILPFIQGSYLFYPLKESGPYTGLGMSIVPYTGWGPLINFPLIVGYQTSDKNHPIFAQFQYSLLTIPGGTFSLGIGF